MSTSTFVTVFWFWLPILGELEGYRVRPEHWCMCFRTAMGATGSEFSRSGPEERSTHTKVEDFAEGLKQGLASHV
jgi:hypothetical protein